MYASGKINTPAGADHGPIIIIFEARMLEINKQVAKRIPASINRTDTLFFIFLVFNVVIKNTWLIRREDIKISISVNKGSLFSGIAFFLFVSSRVCPNILCFYGARMGLDRNGACLLIEETNWNAII